MKASPLTVGSLQTMIISVAGFIVLERLRNSNVIDIADEDSAQVVNQEQQLEVHRQRHFMFQERFSHHLWMT
jgi:hypothetical protein